MNIGIKKTVGAFALLFISNCVFAQFNLPSDLKLPKQQEEFQAQMNQMPVVPGELVGKREGEPYLAKVEKFKEAWDYEAKKDKSKSPKISSINDWLCGVYAAGDGKSKLSTINCYPLNMKRAHLFLWVQNPKAEKLFKGDIIKVSGKVAKLKVSNPVSDINYDMEIKNATYEIVKKGD